MTKNTGEVMQHDYPTETPQLIQKNHPSQSSSPAATATPPSSSTTIELIKKPISNETIECPEVSLPATLDKTPKIDYTKDILLNYKKLQTAAKSEVIALFKQQEQALNKALHYYNERVAYYSYHPNKVCYKIKREQLEIPAEIKALEENNYNRLRLLGTDEDIPSETDHEDQIFNEKHEEDRTRIKQFYLNLKKETEKRENIVNGYIYCKQQVDQYEARLALLHQLQQHYMAAEKEIEANAKLIPLPTYQYLTELAAHFRSNNKEVNELVKCLRDMNTYFSERATETGRRFLGYTAEDYHERRYNWYLIIKAVDAYFQSKDENVRVGALQLIQESEKSFNTGLFSQRYSQNLRQLGEVLGKIDKMNAPVFGCQFLMTFISNTKKVYETLHQLSHRIYNYFKDTEHKHTNIQNLSRINYAVSKYHLFAHPRQCRNKQNPFLATPALIDTELNNRLKRKM